MLSSKPSTRLPSSLEGVEGGSAGAVACNRCRRPGVSRLCPPGPRWAEHQAGCRVSLPGALGGTSPQAGGRYGGRHRH